MKKAILILSGGIDSVTLLFDLRDRGYDIECLSFNYGQKHIKELHVAKKMSTRLGVRWLCVDLRPVSRILGQSDLLARNIRESTKRLTFTGSTSHVYVPNRNMIMLSVAIGRAQATGVQRVMYGPHVDDSEHFNDCRAEFVRRLSATSHIAGDIPVTIIAPFIHMKKGEIVLRGRRLNVPFEQTWSCYSGGTVHCGDCQACIERKKAMRFAGINEPAGFYLK